jgi:hypothetical protein
MFDLETLGTSFDTMILTIAAIQFDPKTSIIRETFYEKIDIDSYKSYSDSFSFDGSTLSWWMLKPTEEARLEAFGGVRKPLKEVIEKLQKWIKDFSLCPIVWSHGSIFDIAILSHTFKVLNVEVPWKFYDIRDTRTLYNIGNVNLKNIITKYSYPDHHAVGDCLKQIEGVKLALMDIALRKNLIEKRPLKRHK